MPQPQRFFTPAQIRAQPRWPAQPGMGGAPRPQMMQPGGPQPMMMARPGMAPVPMGGPQVRGPQPSFQYTKTARNPPMQGMPGQAVVAASMPQQAVQIPGQEPL